MTPNERVAKGIENNDDRDVCNGDIGFVVETDREEEDLVVDRLMAELRGPRWRRALRSTQPISRRFSRVVQVADGFFATVC